MRNRHLYAANWHSVIRPSILARDKFKCTSCGIKQASFGYYDNDKKFVECDAWLKVWALNNGFKPRRVYLQICHLDNNPANNDPLNLSAKCPRCHLKHDHEFNRLCRIAQKANPK